MSILLGAGFSTHNGINEILNEIYKLQDQIEESERDVEIRGKKIVEFGVLNM